ncbi:prepilin-type N-terminal cleavage/methylation domain-containing protein [Patescibacteria group bacterium]|nr:prepilin-type N-terminal cleavage/methylation domain-containing protein [Patescibacteria group bacterium]
MKKYNHNKAGFSLMEMLLAISIFVIIILSSTRIFQLVVQGQRQAIAAYHVQENLKYFFEVMSKEVRMATMDTAGDCPNVSLNQLYTVIGDDLYFKNFEEECVHYYMEDDNGVNRFKIERGSNSGYITTSSVNINSLKFNVQDDVSGGAQLEQPSVTVNLQAEAIASELDKSEMTLQTTISSRYYE